MTDSPLKASLPEGSLGDVALVSVTATAAAAAAAAADCAGMPGGADHRERGELADDIRGAALRAGDLHIPPDELLEVRLTLHADVLVHRHRWGSLGARPDGRQIRSRSC